MSLRDRLVALIGRNGPISVADYMARCLHDAADGYYATHPALGEAGDFITASHVSQMFGELLGLWAADAWSRLGEPSRVSLVELGPGDGTMMFDVLRAARSAPRFLAACEVWLVETSVPLIAVQRSALAGMATPVRWVAAVREIPADAPLIILANEFLDCLPICQAVASDGVWMERRVGLDEANELAFVTGGPLCAPSVTRQVRAARHLPHEEAQGRSEEKIIAPPSPYGGAGRLPSCKLTEGAQGGVFEWSDDLADFGRAIGKLVSHASGAALFVDYGRNAPGFGDTLQALRRHQKESPLANPGLADLTAHVDFRAFLAAARDAGALCAPIRGQGDFLRALGIETRAAALARASPNRRDPIERQLERLIASDQMGELFKVACVHSPGFTPSGFETP